MRDYSTGGNNDVVPDRHARKDCNIRTDPDVIANRYGFCDAQVCAATEGQIG